MPDSHASDPDRDARESDLGFGSVVADATHRRLLNRDGSFNVRRTGLAWRHIVSLYYSLLNLSWPRFILLISLAYLGLNSVFACGYLLVGPGALEGALSDRPFLQAYFFSVETLSTVGYGNISPVSVAAHLLVTVEIMFGLFGIALVVGLVFARFSRPTAEFVFSRNAVIGPYQGKNALMFRTANLRRSQIIELSAKVIFSRFEVDANGNKHRCFHELDLERPRVAFFPLSWTIVHPIDETSPLMGQGNRSFVSADAEFMVLLTGFDESFSQTVHTRTSYTSPEVIRNARFKSILELPEGDQPVSIDVSRIHEIERLD